MLSPALRPWLAGLAGWLALAAITAAQNYAFLAWAGRPIGAWHAIWRELIMFGTWAVLTPPIVAVTRWAQRSPAARAVHVPAMLACSLAHNVLLVAARFAIEDGPLPPFVDQLWGTLGRAFVLDVVFYAAVVFVVEAVTWSAAYRRRVAEAARLEADLARSRLDALRGQLQPHFLFNALHAASSLIDTDPAGARRMIVRLSELLRATLEVRAPVVTLAEELALLERYLDVLRVRFHDRLTVTIDVPAELRGAAVPPLVLQPLVENAARHGIGARPEAGVIAISARRLGGRLRLVVADDGAGLEARHEERVGLGATRRRLAALHGDAAALTLSARAAGGTEAAIELPYEEAPCAP